MTRAQVLEAAQVVLDEREPSFPGEEPWLEWPTHLWAHEMNHSTVGVFSLTPAYERFCKEQEEKLYD